MCAYQRQCFFPVTVFDKPVTLLEKVPVILKKVPVKKNPTVLPLNIDKMPIKIYTKLAGKVSVTKEKWL